MPDLLLLALSVILALLLGFAAHRGGICTVKAVAEILSTRRAYMLASFAKTVLWVMVAVGVALAFLPGGLPPATAYAPAAITFAGGLMFGIGAAVNQGCAFSALSKLAGGDFGFFVTALGFSAGLVLFSALDGAALLPAAGTPPAVSLAGAEWAPWLLAPLSLWALWELWRLWRSRSRGLAIRASVLAAHYRLSSVALLIGLSGGTLYALHGSWTYTGSLKTGLDAIYKGAAAPPLINGLLFAALLFGMGLSVWQRGVFRPRRPTALGALRNLLGGAMMGFGAAFVPGGNDVLILHDLPLLLPHAGLAYGAVLLGTALPLLGMRLMTGRFTRLDCSGDLCTED